MTGSVLVLNSGSSSVKFALGVGGRRIKGLVERLRQPGCVLTISDPELGEKKQTKVPDADTDEIMKVILRDKLPNDHHVDLATIEGVGHRIVHGGPLFKRPTIINNEVIQQIESLVPLAPLHNPGGIMGIRAAMAALDKKDNNPVRHVACFDTAFHSSLAPQYYTYPLPYQMSKELLIRKYGFHGISVEYVFDQACKLTGLNPGLAQTVVCHLGSGCSVTAVAGGRSVNTTMGLTPLEGVAMMTRCGSIDPGIIQYISRVKGMPLDDVMNMLNKESGMVGLSGKSDMREIIEAASRSETSAMHNKEETERCKLAVDVFVREICEAVSHMYVTLGRVDMIVFCGGIGENARDIREKIIDRFGYRGWRICPEKNCQNGLRDDGKQGGIITHERSSIFGCVIPTDEEAQIESDTRRLLGMVRGTV